MAQIVNFLTINDLHRLMQSGNSSVSLKAGASHSERLDKAVNALLESPEGMHFEDLGEGLGIYVVRNNTIISPQGLYLGGVRWNGYDNEDAAVMDARKLARGMTHKWAMLNLMLANMAVEGRATIEEVNASRMGGGKAVINDNHYDKKRFSAFNHPSLDVPLNDLEMKVLDRVAPVIKLLGRYVFAPDMNTDTRHVDYMSQSVPGLVACLSSQSGGSGDPSVITARGVYESMLETVKFRFGVNNLDGLTIALQGIGKVGSHVVKYIISENKNVRFVITDKDEAKALEMVSALGSRGFDAIYVPSETVYDQQFDIFSPNATGQILNPTNVKKMIAANTGKRFVVVGGANNQIDDRNKSTREETEALLHEYDITYAPDFVVNLGGILNLIYELPDVKKGVDGSYNQEIPLDRIKGVRPILNHIFSRNLKRGEPTQSIAERLAEEHIARYALFNRLNREDLIQRNYKVSR
ncbi:hypothetical protein HY637_02860 [Candidatus Woesearchaeota archaeon]|nr:hypothetical protein [Candidatus Woesearchaeota archaeon]